jgi:small nuclear ribonucleoprotein (snRNP)-like protein
MIQNKIVVRYQDGRILKGTTGNFLPTKPTFHVSVIDGLPDAKPIEVQIAELKAIFFVRDFAGDAQHKKTRGFQAGKPAVGRKIRVMFPDGEMLVGTTQGYDPNRPGFFVIPADADSNNERCFVVIRATTQVSFI